MSIQSDMADSWVQELQADSALAGDMSAQDRVLVSRLVEYFVMEWYWTSDDADHFKLLFAERAGSATAAIVAAVEMFRAVANGREFDPARGLT